MNYKHTGAGALFYARSTGRCLFVLRSTTCDAPRTWCSVGGGVESGESLHEAVLRECQEEIGVRPNCSLVLLKGHRIRNAAGATVYTYYNYLGIVDEEFDCVLNDEHTAYRWAPLSEIPLPLHPEFRKVLTDENVLPLLSSLK